ncbi:MAG: allantoinase AllB [Ignavibacteria bacterium]|nr:allantoinase AllB [Ignavibacteria bacterium]
MQSIKSKKVLINGELIPASIFIDKGKITGVKSYSEEAEDFGDLVIMPGVVDTHVHINEPGRTEWEGFETATKSAAAGGITTLVDMPLNSSPVTTSKKNFDIKLEAAKGKLWVDCGFYGGAVSDNINELKELCGSGVLGIKSFMIDSGLDEFKFVSESDLRNALNVMKDFDLPLLVHAEVLTDSEKGIANTFSDFVKYRPHEMEDEAIKILINLCKEFNTHIHIVHLSSADSLAQIRKAKSEGLNLTVETCPHYLYFNAEDIPQDDARFKCTPPIRSKENNEKLWEALEDGTIDMIASDHSPCTHDLKAKIFSDAWGGIASLQVSFPAVWTKAKEKGIGIDKVSKWMSRNTAKLVSLDKYIGTIEEGKYADFTIFNPEESFIAEPDSLHHKNKISAYHHEKLFGKVHTVFLNGEKIFDEGKFSTEPKGKIILKVN